MAADLILGVRLVSIEDEIDEATNGRTTLIPVFRRIPAMRSAECRWSGYSEC